MFVSFSHLYSFSTIDAKVGFCFICCIYTGCFVRISNNYIFLRFQFFVVFFNISWVYYCYISTFFILHQVEICSFHVRNSFILTAYHQCLYSGIASVISTTLLHYTFIVVQSWYSSTVPSGSHSRQIMY
jgi:hypothetical protein